MWNTCYRCATLTEIPSKKSDQDTACIITKFSSKPVKDALKIKQKKKNELILKFYKF